MMFLLLVQPCIPALGVPVWAMPAVLLDRKTDVSISFNGHSNHGIDRINLANSTG